MKPELAARLSRLLVSCYPPSGLGGGTVAFVIVWNVTNPRAVTRITTITSNRIGIGEVAFAPGGYSVAGAPAIGGALAVWTQAAPAPALT
jgi:hypothetical protein